VANWVEACRTDDVEEEDVIPVALEGCPYAVYHSPDGQFYAYSYYSDSSRLTLVDGGPNWWK